MAGYKSIWVFLEQNEGVLEEVSLEVLGKASELASKVGAEVTGILLGHNVKRLADEAIKRGAESIILADSPVLENYMTETYTEVIAGLVKERNPDAFIFGATNNGVDLAGRLAVRLGAGLIAHVVELELEEETGLLLGSVPGFGGSILAVCKCVKGRPQMVTVRPGIFRALPPDESRKGRIEEVQVRLKPEDIKTRIVEKKVGKAIDISKAEKVVIGGVGTGGDLSLIKRLAELIGGEVGVTRPLSDQGIAPRDIMVGATGVGLSSKLAIVAGVSGAAHFLSGIDKVENVIAINTDPDANIFNHADYCVVGDLFKIMPELIKRIESLKG
ncbi:MAG: electron transfer flavoprotein subunit alpha/FixB family protein [Nitrososphaerota archaeon]